MLAEPVRILRRREAPAQHPAVGRATVVLIPGDGIGPEITRAVRRVLEAAGAPLDWEVCEAGEAVFAKGVTSGLPRETIDAVARHGVLLKGPLATPAGHGRDAANPTALLLSAVMMLRHLGRPNEADRVEGALLYVLEQGRVRTADFARDRAAGTQAFADAVIGALGEAPRTIELRSRHPFRLPRPAPAAQPLPGLLCGADVFVQSDLGPAALAGQLEPLTADLPLRLKMISNRGVQVYPETGAMPDLADVYRCRFVSTLSHVPLSEDDLLVLLSRTARTVRWMHVEKLHEFGGKPGYTLAQGEH